MERRGSSACQVRRAAQCRINVVTIRARRGAPLCARARAFFLSRGEHAAGARARAHFVRIGDNRNDEVACGVMLYHSRERLLERPLIGENVVAVGSGDVLLQLH